MLLSQVGRCNLSISIPRELCGAVLMIKGMHGIFFTPEAEEARDFVREKLEPKHAQP